MMKKEELASKLFNIIIKIKTSSKFQLKYFEKNVFVYDFFSMNYYELDSTFKGLFQKESLSELLSFADDFTEKVLIQIEVVLGNIISTSENTFKSENSTNIFDTYSISINPNSNCNLNCVYCFTNKGLSSRNVKYDLFIKAIDKLVYVLGKDLKEQCVTFKITSEPLLDLNTMSKLVDYVRDIEQKTGKTLIFHFVTNGTIINDKAIEIIKKARGVGGYVHISLDGPEEVHNKQRKWKNGGDTYSSIINTIEILKGEGFKIATSSVITNNFPYPHKILEHLLTLNIDRIYMKPVRSCTDYSFDSTSLKVLLESYNECFSFLETLIKSKETDTINKIKNDYFVKYISILLRDSWNTIRCSWNTHNISMDNLGDLYTCDSFIGMLDYKIGNINTGFEEKVLNKSVNTFEREPCKNCWAKYICGGTCYYDSLKTKGSILGTYNIECEINKYLIHSSLNIIFNYAYEHKSTKTLADIFV